MKTLYTLLTIICLTGFQFGCSPADETTDPVTPTETTPETPTDTE